MIRVKDFHREVQGYIEKRGNHPTDQILQYKESPEYKSLFVLIDACLAKTSNQNYASGDYHPEDHNLHKMKKQVLRLCQGITVQKGSEFLNSLLNSPEYLERVIQIFNDSNVSDVSLDDIHMKSDRELLHMAGCYESTSNSGRIRDKFAAYYHKRMPLKTARFALVASILILFISLPIFLHRNINPLYQKYFQSGNLPCEYNNIAFRGSSQSLQTESPTQNIRIQFDIAMSDYLVKDYSRALVQLEAIDINSAKDSNSSTKPESLQLYRDIWFYKGICKLALAGGHDKSLLRAAASDFTNAEELVNTYNLKGGAREYFFMALAQDLLGHKPAALAYLGKIQEGSIYYNDSQNRIKQLTN